MDNLHEIYMPLVKEYIDKYTKYPSFTEDWPPANLAIPYSEQLQVALNTAHREGLYEGLNNGFIEGFMKCVEYFDIINEYHINKLDN